LVKTSGERHGLRRHLGGELAEAFAKHPIERRKGVDDVSEHFQRRAQFDGEQQLAQDLARARTDDLT